MPEYRHSTSSEALGTVTGTGIVVRGDDIDTDRIIPARYMKVVTFDGLGDFAFRDVRFDDNGNALRHPFNEPAYQSASILFVNKNFGCGSSREHAPQALMRWGIRAVVGESFAEIFAGNCNALGIPAVTVSRSDIDTVMDAVEAKPETPISITLADQTITVGQTSMLFHMPEAYLQSLLGGTWDSTAVLLRNSDLITQTAAGLPYLSSFK